MHSFEIKESLNHRTRHSPAYGSNTYDEVTITILIKTLSTIKLHYPDGIEIDLPRTYRSVFSFSFVISPYSRSSLLPKHFEWLIEAIQKRTPYKLIATSYGSVEYQDDAIVWITGYDYAESSYYLPLEYCRDDVIHIFRQIINIYERYLTTIIHVTKIERNLANLAPTKFPVLVRSHGMEIRYYRNHFYNDLFSLSDIEENDQTQSILDVLNSYQHSDNAHNSIEYVVFDANTQKIIFRDQDIEINTSNDDGTTAISWSLPMTFLPRLRALLNLTDKQIKAMNKRGDFIQASI